MPDKYISLRDRHTFHLRYWKEKPNKLRCLFKGRLGSFLHFSVCNQYMCAKLFQLCPTLGDPKGYSPPDSFIHAIVQAKILEWLATSSSRLSS